MILHEGRAERDFCRGVCVGGGGLGWYELGAGGREGGPLQSPCPGAQTHLNPGLLTRTDG